jgi:hypothetical protein
MEIALFAAMNRLSISRVLASVPRILLRAILVFGAKRLIGAAPAAATTKSQQQLEVVYLVRSIHVLTLRSGWGSMATHEGKRT